MNANAAKAMTIPSPAALSIIRERILNECREIFECDEDVGEGESCGDRDVVPKAVGSWIATIVKTE